MLSTSVPLNNPSSSVSDLRQLREMRRGEWSRPLTRAESAQTNRYLVDWYLVRARDPFDFFSGFEIGRSLALQIGTVFWFGSVP